jgi:hypothetical protein
MFFNLIVSRWISFHDKYKEFFLTIINYIHIFATMKICHHCKKEINLENFIGRQEQCPVCGADLHCCLNCTFYERGAYNDCKETQAERVLDKARSNFCDFFSFRLITSTGEEKASGAKDKLESLFKK